MQSLSAEKCAAFLLTGKVSVLSGAGISTAAGIPDFRGPKGLYVTRQYDPNTVFDINYFRCNPQPFFDFSRDFLGALSTITPTFTHQFLAALESDGLLEHVITQNIDPLHQQSGTTNIICLHGNYFTSHCHKCSAEYSYESFLNKLGNEDIPACDKCGGVVKPDVVFFGEAVWGMDRAGEIVKNSNTLLVLGSSLVVYPAAILPQLAKLVIAVNQSEINLAPSKNSFHVQDDIDSYFRAVAAHVKTPAVQKLLQP